MNKQFVSCPQCANDALVTYSYAVVCRACGWSLPDSDPRYREHVEELGLANVRFEGPIIEALEALPSNFGASLTTTRSALPASHPVHSDSPYSLTAAEFKRRREQFGLSADWLAERLGVALKTVQRWENGHRPIPDGIEAEMDTISTAIGHLAAAPIAEQLLATPDGVMMIPRSGTHLGFPASWYRAVVDSVRHILQTEHGEEGLSASRFRVVYLDEVEEQK
ncbi:helix-turn-helix domain-containing protein [Tessaracoccus massiliensis]|uniref:helix-turn-helix domain-containing protein n=1 Tax=Tessaracoccus massiliensis TaxID=1522311 RepID=UPI00058DA61E|nr:helix-turn-helix domain-containing protein [Tessaracoccus massiliensis]